MKKSSVRQFADSSKKKKSGYARIYSFMQVLIYGGTRTMRQRSPERNSISIKTVIGGIFCILLGFLLLCNLIIIVKGTVNPEKPPSVFGITPMVVLSGSMSGDAEDHIEVGDLIFVGNEEPENLQVGDVIAYMSGGTAVTHRITEINTDEDSGLLFTTKGDANEAEDTEAVTEEQVIGVYQVRIPKAGDFALFLQQPQGMLLFIGVPLLAFIIYDIIRRQRYAGREKAKAQEMEAELERLRSLAGENNPHPAGCGKQKKCVSMRESRSHTEHRRDINVRPGSSRRAGQPSLKGCSSRSDYFMNKEA